MMVMNLRCPGLIIASLLLFCMTLLAACSGPPPPQSLRILTWPGYADEDVVEGFEKRHNAVVDVTYIATDDEMWGRVNQNDGQDFDVFAVNTAELQRYLDNGLSQAINLANIPNIRNQLPRFRDRDGIPGISRDESLFAVPYTYGVMGLLYDKSRVKEPPVSMAAMWDERYKGRVLAYNGSSHNFTMTALMMGYANPFRLSDGEFAVVSRELVKLGQNVLTFYDSPEEAVVLYKDNPVALVFGNYGMQQLKQLQDAGADMGFVIPKEGALAWLDCWSVLKGAKNKALAEAWINYTLEKAVSDVLTARQGLPNTVSATRTILEEDKIIWLQPVEDTEKRSRFWQQIRSGDTMDKF
jgi:putative spermidine/putrescine transport system substrate-binding protein